MISVGDVIMAGIGTGYEVVSKTSGRRDPSTSPHNPVSFSYWPGRLAEEKPKGLEYGSLEIIVNQGYQIKGGRLRYAGGTQIRGLSGSKDAGRHDAKLQRPAGEKEHGAQTGEKRSERAGGGGQRQRKKRAVAIEGRISSKVSHELRSTAYIDLLVQPIIWRMGWLEQPTTGRDEYLGGSSNEMCANCKSMIEIAASDTAGHNWQNFILPTPEASISGKALLDRSS